MNVRHESRWRAALQRGWANPWLRLGLGCGLLALLIMRMDCSALRAVGSSFNLLYAVPMLVVSGLTLLAFAWRWCLIGRSLGLEAPFWAYLRGLWISQAAGELGPTLVAGELARFHALSGHADPGRLAISQLVDRASGQIVLLLLVAALLPVLKPVWAEASTHFVGAAGLVVLLIVMLLAGFVLAVRIWPFLRSHTRQIGRLFDPFRCPGHYLLSLLIQGLLVLNLLVAALGLGRTDALPTLALLGPVLLLGIGSLPGVISDWGKREWLAVGLFGAAGLSAEQSLTLSLLYGTAHTLMALPGLLLFRLRTGSASDPGV